jgi:hypothetical protein
LKVPAPPAPLGPVNPYILAAGEVIHRIHDGNFTGNSFNPCRGQPTRFAPITNPKNKCIPSLHAADSLQAAAFEAVFHNIPAKARLMVVQLSNVQSRAHSELELKRDITLAKLFQPDLKALGITRARLMTSNAKHYGQTALWAKAIHNQYHDIDGLIWTSNQCDPERAFLFFGDHVRAKDLKLVSTTKVLNSGVLLSRLRRIGARANIVITT